MGRKYFISGKRNGMCPWNGMEKTVNSRLLAIFWFFIISRKYPIVDLEQRLGYKECPGCEQVTDCPGMDHFSHMFDEEEIII